ncbi:MAG: hypothetical protein COS14_06950 [Bacteroidetes bacterium CG02_land_8_20_14_3_00_31_25]|nr:hypothetical protein [Bacteroidota bacterium]PIV58938.1 MAG: hypothetical protein COS14_06950 [Bacteroidetes bacterium CG02_land_8_20_14_3_00_31_25]PIX35787.1 MAG: hypothetical protein COZ59_04565 [Bacteroidetes bacterium CG_4_8_14_3_um_filter_31_14]PIY02756.1 MAG: hypothetical protein COZ21_12500 [Bacteroidetes bacterium CG_4_10_14_3_um_filter_31_20]
MEDHFPDKIFVRHHFTDFEKLLFALKYIEELKKILDNAEQEISRLKSFSEKNKELMQQINILKKLTKKEKIEAHNIEENKLLKNTIKNFQNKIKILEKKNRELVNEIIRIKMLNYKP